MKRLFAISLCVLALAACNRKPDTTTNEQNQRWPDFLREWAADYNIDDPQRISLINLIDSVYCFFEDSTLHPDDYLQQVCQMINRMSDVIANDTLFEFTLMMRATAANFFGFALKDERFFQCNCSVDALVRIVEWQISTSEDAEDMTFTFMPASWRTPWHFANLGFIIGKDDQEPCCILMVTNYEDFLMDSIHISFLDSNYIVMHTLNEEEVYVDSTDAANGMKFLVLPCNYMMQAIQISSSVVISYKTTQEWFVMRGVPIAGFSNQINDCPRLKAAFDKVTSKGGRKAIKNDEILNNIGQPIRQVVHKTTGKVLDIDSTWYLDTVWSEKYGGYILDMKQH